MNPLAVMSLASIRVQASAPPSAPQVASPGVSHHLPMFQAPVSTTARMPAPSTPAAFSTTPSDAGVVIPSVPPPPSAPSAVPPPPASSVRYERAFRSWSYSTPPPSEVEGGDAEASQGPLTYQVYTAQDIAVAPRASRMNFANAAPPPVPLHKRVGMMITGAAIVLCTAAAVMLGVVDDGPKAPRESASASVAPPPAAIDPLPASPDPASVTTTTSFIPPVVTIVDDPDAPAPAPKPKKKKVTTDGTAPASGSIINVSANAANAPAPPPNPYAVSKK